jgi:hypothetical protein
MLRHRNQSLCISREDNRLRIYTNVQSSSCQVTKPDKQEDEKEILLTMCSIWFCVHVLDIHLQTEREQPMFDSYDISEAYQKPQKHNQEPETLRE